MIPNSSNKLETNFEFEPSFQRFLISVENEFQEKTGREKYPVAVFSCFFFPLHFSWLTVRFAFSDFFLFLYLNIEKEFNY